MNAIDGLMDWWIDGLMDAIDGCDENGFKGLLSVYPKSLFLKLDLV